MRARYWYVTPAAEAAVKAAIASDHRRTWNPLSDSPSLSTLAGKAKRFGDRYEHSRKRLFAAAGVSVTYRMHYFRGDRCRRLVGIVRCAS